MSFWLFRVLGGEIKIDRERVERKDWASSIFWIDPAPAAKLANRYREITKLKAVPFNLFISITSLLLV